LRDEGENRGVEQCPITPGQGGVRNDESVASLNRARTGVRRYLTDQVVSPVGKLNSMMRRSQLEVTSIAIGYRHTLPGVRSEHHSF
jgi:hypothetical protein